MPKICAEAAGHASAAEVCLLTVSPALASAHHILGIDQMQSDIASIN